MRNPSRALLVATFVLLLINGEQGERGYFPKDASEYGAIPYPYEDILPGGWGALNERQAQRESLKTIVLMSGVANFVRYEGRFPKDLREVLDSPYSSLSAQDAVDPILGVSYVDMERSLPLAESWTFDLREDLTRAFITVTLSARDPQTREVVAISESLRGWPATSFLVRNFEKPTCHFRFDKSSVDVRELQAESVQTTLDLASLHFLRSGRNAKDHSELVSRYAFIAKLKNGFTSGYARLDHMVTYASLGESPAIGNPGNFIFVLREKHPFYIVFGADGARVLLKPRAIEVGPCHPQ
jgi:hypothetical protein